MDQARGQIPGATATRGAPSSGQLLTDQNYRAFWRCDAGDGWFKTLREQLASWLLKKSWDIDLSQDDDHDRENGSIQIRHHSSSAGNDFRLVMEEHGPNGLWRTELIAHDRRSSQDDWVCLDITNDQGHFVAVPHLARYLMTDLGLADGSISFDSKPRVLDEFDDELFLDALADGERHGLIFATGTDDRLSFASYLNKVAIWTEQVHGLAEVLVLTPDLTSKLERTIDRYAPPPWTIRTYFPKVDLDSSVDFRRHRMLGSQRLGSMKDGGIKNLLGIIARAHAAERPQPAEVVRVRRAFERIENRRLIASVDGSVQKPSSPNQPIIESALTSSVDTVHDYLAQVTLVKAVLGIDTLNEESLREVADLATTPRIDAAALDRAAEKIETLQSRTEELDDQFRLASELLNDAQINEAVLFEDLAKAQARIQYLQRQLRGYGDTSAYSPTPDSDLPTYPDNFEQLLDWIAADRAPGITFTGDAKTTIQLSNKDDLGAAVRTCWDACQVLSDYVRARREGDWSAGVKLYLQQTPDGYRTISPNKHSPVETRATMQEFGDFRRFPVPAAVCDVGVVAMEAHFKLARIGMVSPRMHYYDDFTKTRSVYVGYIGPHLPNTQTN